MLRGYVSSQYPFDRAGSSNYMDDTMPMDEVDPLVSTRAASPPTTGEIVATIASALGTAPSELPPLQESIDSEAVQRVLETGHRSRLSFRYYGFRIVVGADGTVAVYPGGDRPE